jgi:hypothetical protein
MNRDTKKMLKIVGSVNYQVVAVQVEDYCPSKYKVKVVDVKEYIEEEKK